MVKRTSGVPRDERREPTGATAEERQPLWLIALSPTVWAAHFLACYVTAAVWCAKVAGPGGELGLARTLVWGYTAAALLAIGATLWVGVRRFRAGAGSARHRDLPSDRHRFLGWATVLLSGLSMVAVVYVALVAAVVRSCL